MRQRVYLDTSVIGGYLDKEFQKWSRKPFDEFKTGKKIAVISGVTLEKIENAKQEVIDLLKLIPEESKKYVLNDAEVEELADKKVL